MHNQHVDLLYIKRERTAPTTAVKPMVGATMLLTAAAWEVDEEAEPLELEEELPEPPFMVVG